MTEQQNEKPSSVHSGQAGASLSPEVGPYRPGDLVRAIITGRVRRADRGLMIMVDGPPDPIDGAALNGAVYLVSAEQVRVVRHLTAELEAALALVRREGWVAYKP